MPSLQEVGKAQCRGREDTDYEDGGRKKVHGAMVPPGFAERVDIDGEGTVSRNDPHPTYHVKIASS